MWQCFRICEGLNLTPEALPTHTPHPEDCILWRFSHEGCFIVFTLYSLNK